MLLKWLNLSPDAGEGGGDQGGEGQRNGDQHLFDGGSEGEEGQGGEGGEGGEGKGKEGEGDEGEGKSTGLTKDDITDILSRVMPAGEARGGAARQPERQMTQAEIETLLNVWKPDVSFLKKLGFAEPTAEQLTAVHEMRDNLIKQANTMSEARVQQLLGEYKGQLDELHTYVSEQKAQQTESSFYAANPELKKYEVVVSQVSQKLEESGFKAPTQKQVFEEIVKNTQAVLKEMGIVVEKGKGGGSGSGSAGRGGNRMSQLTGGGQGGGGKGNGKGNQRKAGMEIFDSDEQ